MTSHRFGTVLGSKALQLSVFSLPVPGAVALAAEQTALEFIGLYALTFVVACALMKATGTLSPFWPRLNR